MINWTKSKYASLDQSHPHHTKLVRFVIAGGSATAVNLGILFILTHFLGIWYLLSSIIAFLCAFTVSFSLQKFWTFRDHIKEDMHKQASLFFLSMIGGIIANTLILYFLVEYQHFHYLLAQMISGIIIAVANFLIYGKIFKRA